MSAEGESASPTLRKTAEVGGDTTDDVAPEKRKRKDTAGAKMTTAAPGGWKHGGGRAGTKEATGVFSPVWGRAAAQTRKTGAEKTTLWKGEMEGRRGMSEGKARGAGAKAASVGE